MLPAHAEVQGQLRGDVPVVTAKERTVELLSCHKRWSKRASARARAIAQEKRGQAGAACCELACTIVARQVGIERKCPGGIVRLCVVMRHPHELASEPERVVSGDFGQSAGPTVVVVPIDDD